MSQVKVVQPNGVVRMLDAAKARRLGWKLFVEPVAVAAPEVVAAPAPKKRGRPRKVVAE